jgi:hypothetical protein
MQYLLSDVRACSTSVPDHLMAARDHVSSMMMHDAQWRIYHPRTGIDAAALIQ